MTRHIPARRIHRGIRYTGPYPSDGALAFAALTFCDIDPWDDHVPQAYRVAARILLPKRRRPSE